MIPLLGALVFLLGTSYGHFSTHNFDYWNANFTTRLEKILKRGDIDISSQCNEHLLQYLQGLKSRELWAMKMLDAGAEIPLPGVLDGNLVDLGSFDECLNIEERKNKAQIFGKYCIGEMSIYITSNSRIRKRSVINTKRFRLGPPDPNNEIDIQLAKCFPDACSTTEMAKVYGETGIEIDFDHELCQTKADQPKLDSGSIATIFVFGAILLVVIISTVYDMVLYYLEKKPAHTMLTAFSALTNGRKLIKTSNSSNEISCLHGLRAISTMWVILAHVYSIQNNYPMRNSFFFFNWFNDEANMFVILSNLSVDTFLFLTGLLIVYNYMNAAMKGVKFNIILYYLHRYLRMTPALAVVMVFHISLLQHVGSGPIWLTINDPKLMENCQENWWKTLLYIQNVLGRESLTCIPPSWYSSVDMQLFILSPFFLVPLKRFPRFTLGVTVFLAGLSMTACFLIAWIFELNPHAMGNLRFDQQMDFFWYYFFQTHTRSVAWLIGIVFGYIVFKTKQGQMQFPKNKAIILSLWVGSLTILCTCLFAGHNLIDAEFQGKPNTLANSIHMALARPAWAIAIGWIVVASVNGYGGPVNWFLSLPVFQFIAKLSYSLYLVHYTVISIIHAQMRTPPLFSNFQAFYKYWGDFACSLVVSVVLVLAIELPMLEIDKFLFGPKKAPEKMQKPGVL